MYVGLLLNLSPLSPSRCSRRVMSMTMTMQALLAPEASKLPPRTQGVYVQNALKVLIAMCHQQACSDDGELGRALDMVPGRLRVLMRSPHMEVSGAMMTRALV